MSNVINEFKDEYFFLSNYYTVPIQYEGINYTSTEAAFQAQKCKNAGDRLTFARLTPSQSKYVGRHITLRDDWEDVKYDMMYKIVYAKFTQNKLLTKKLIETGDAELIEGNTWHDKIWGVDIKTGEGRNELGKILMKIRDELKINK